MASTAVLSRDLASLGLRPLDAANDAMFATLGWYQVALVLTAIAASGFVAAQAFARHFDARRHVAVENVLMLWLFVAGSAALTVMALYVSPHLLR